MNPSPLRLTGLRARADSRSEASSLDRVYAKLDDGAASTVHVARYPRRAFAARVALLEEPLPLVRWCAQRSLRHALVGGFFLRPQYVPLGAIWIDGSARRCAPFDPPWNQLRACLHISDSVRIAPLRGLGPSPSGDLLQAGPLLVTGGKSVIDDSEDPEGFSAGAHQFDSDIARGRYPRAALGVTPQTLLAVVCDGRTDRDAGMTLGELAEAMVALGADSAINLDGGGSATLVHDGRLRNRPREQHGADLLEGRPVVSAITFEPRWVSERP